MNATLQTIIALAIVALTAVWLVRRAVTKQPGSGCGGNCSAVSPEVKKLRAKLRH